LIKEKDPVEVISEVVKDEHIDLIIMAAHEEGRLEHLLLGHCNDEIIRTMPYGHPLVPFCFDCGIDSFFALL
jgi:nucleotide-binding universal stress UspA family protein